MKNSRKKLTFVLFLFLAAPLVFSKTISVPCDYPTIKSAVCAAQGGDSVEVENGNYFEENIVIDKSIKLKAKNLLGAIIYGSGCEGNGNFIFQIKAGAEIEGFILKNSCYGIIQRDSPDVGWTARMMAVLNMSRAGVSVNDRGKNIGRASISNIIVESSKAAFSTNDAYGMDVKNCLIANCRVAFSTFDHIYFTANRVMTWNCGLLTEESSHPPLPGATNKISLGEEIVNLDNLLLNGNKKNQNLLLSSSPDVRLNPHSGERDRHLRIWQAMALAIAGDVFYRLKDLEKSSDFFHSALLLGKKVKSQEVVWRAQYGLGLVLEKRGDCCRALDRYKKAASVLENIRCGLPLRIYCPGFFSDKRKIYESLISLLWEMHRKDFSKGYDREAFLIAEKSRARAFLDGLHEFGLDLYSKTNPALIGNETRILQEISQLQIQLQDTNLSSSKQQALLERLDQAESEFIGILARMKTANVKGVYLPYPQPDDYDEIQKKLLNDQTVLLEYVLGEERSFAFLATSRELAISPLPPSNEIQALVTNYLKFLSLRGAKRFAAAKGGKRLFDLLLGPFEAKLGKNVKTIIVIPDENLHYLPFGALIRKMNGDQKRGFPAEKGKEMFLTEDFEFVYAFSASALIHLKEREARKKKPMELLAIADSALGIPRKSCSGSQSASKPLKHVEQEIQAVADFFKKDAEVILSGRAAEEGEIKKLPLQNFRIIHFATHGIFDNKNWRHSCLVLRCGSDGSEDGLLQPRDILKLNLGADLVVLSACQTGKGRLEKGEGLLGFSSTFLWAGARAVLVSLWNINDRSTAAFMKSFYRHLSEGKIISQALKLTKMEMIHSKHGHPFHWAAFVLIGDASSRVFP